jgi:hypothetical protein
VKIDIHNHEHVGRKASFMLVSFLAYSSILKKEATCLFETLVDFQRATRRYIPEGRSLHISICLFLLVRVYLYLNMKLFTTKSGDEKGSLQIGEHDFHKCVLSNVTPVVSVGHLLQIQSAAGRANHH